jgi:hypothetical protein
LLGLVSTPATADWDASFTVERRGSIFATLRITDDEDARAIARRILELYHGPDRFLRER